MLRVLIPLSTAGLLGCGPVRSSEAEDSFGATSSSTDTSTATMVEDPDTPDAPDETARATHLAYVLGDPAGGVHVARVSPDGTIVEATAVELSIPSLWSGALEWSNRGDRLVVHETEYDGSRIVVWSLDGTTRELEQPRPVGDIAWFGTEDGLVARGTRADDSTREIMVLDLRGSSIVETKLETPSWKSCAVVTPDAEQMFFTAHDKSLRAGRIDRSVPGMPVVDHVDIGLSAASCGISHDGRWVSAFDGGHAYIIPVADDQTSIIDVGVARTCDEFGPASTWAPTEALFVFQDWRVISGELCQGSLNDQWTQDLWLVDGRDDRVPKSILLADGGSAPSSAAFSLGWQATTSGASRLLVAGAAEPGGRVLRIFGFHDGIVEVASVALPPTERLFAASLAPGAEAIVYGLGAGSEARLFLASTPDWTPRALGLASSSTATCLWSPDGAHIVCPVDVAVDGERSAQLRSFETTGGEPEGTRIDEPSALARWPVIAAFSREGELLVYVGKASDAGSERLHFVPFEAASPRLDHRFSLELPGTVRRIAWQP